MLDISIHYAFLVEVCKQLNANTVLSVIHIKIGSPSSFLGIQSVGQAKRALDVPTVCAQLGAHLTRLSTAKSKPLNLTQIVPVL